MRKYNVCFVESMWNLYEVIKFIVYFLKTRTEMTLCGSFYASIKYIKFKVRSFGPR